MQHPIPTYGYGFLFSVCGYFGVHFVIALVHSHGALTTVTGKWTVLHARFKSIAHGKTMSAWYGRKTWNEDIKLTAAAAAAAVWIDHAPTIVEKVNYPIVARLITHFVLMFVLRPTRKRPSILSKSINCGFVSLHLIHNYWAWPSFTIYYSNMWASLGNNAKYKFKRGTYAIAQCLVLKAETDHQSRID